VKIVFLQLELTWAMPSLLHLYKSKPHQYISWIIGHEGKGSLISYLRKKMWSPISDNNMFYCETKFFVQFNKDHYITHF